MSNATVPFRAAVTALLAIVTLLAGTAGAASAAGGASAGRATVLDVSRGVRPVMTFATPQRTVLAARVGPAKARQALRGTRVTYRATAAGRVVQVRVLRKRARTARFTTTVERAQGRTPRLRLTKRVSLLVRARYRVLRGSRRVARRAVPHGARARVTWRLARRGRIRTATIRLDAATPQPSLPAAPLAAAPPEAQDAAAAPPAPVPAPSASPAPPPGRSLYWGAIVDGLAPTAGNMAAGGAFDRFERRAGKKMSLIQWGQPWKSDGAFQAFPRAYAENVRRHGSIPVINWCSWELGKGAEQPAFQLRDVTAGHYDGYIRQWALDAKAWGHPLMLRLNHEMNGWWYPWGEGKTSTGAIVNGNAPGDFARAWRHVHAIFEQAGATNVSWLWSPNITAISPRYPSMAGLYPGGDTVDWTGLSVYAKAGQYEPAAALLSGAGTTYLADSYGAVVGVAPDKPMLLAETGAAETGDGGATKAAWIRDLLGTQLAGRFPHIRGFVWFDWAETGFETMPIASSAAALQAFAEGIRSPLYMANAYAGLSASPIPPPVP